MKTIRIVYICMGAFVALIGAPSSLQLADAQPTLAAAGPNIEACKIWANEAEKKEGAADRLKKFFVGLFRISNSDVTVSINPQPGYYFTNKSSVSSQPRCRD